MTYLTVYDRQGASCRVQVEDEPKIDAAVTDHLDSGRTRNSIIQLTAINGMPYRILASEVTSWLMSSPESRRVDDEIDRTLKAECGPE